MKVLSFGAGVNSTAILCLCKEGKLKLDLIIFADTKGENPETYKYIEDYIKPLCKKLYIPFKVVCYGDLLKDYTERNIIPFRMFRSCTDKYKIRPIKKVIPNDANIILGIDYGEQKRAKRFIGSFSFPLIDLEIDREQCKKIIRRNNLPIPIKSGCFFCPFTKRKEWIKLLKNHRDLFLKAENFEKNCSKYPKYTLTKIPLQRIRESIDNQQSLCNWVDKEESCIFCSD